MPNWSRKTPQWRPEEAHNGYIDVYAQLGGIGLALMLIVIGVAFAGALTDLQNNFQFGSLRLALLLGIVLNNLSESSLLLGTHDLWFLFILVVVNLPRPTGKALSNKEDESINHSVIHDQQPLRGDALPSSRFVLQHG